MKNIDANLTALKKAAMLLQKVLSTLDRGTKKCGGCGLMVQSCRAEYQSHKTLEAAHKRIVDTVKFIHENRSDYEES